VRLRKNSAAVAIAPPGIAPEIMWSVRGLGSVSDRAAPVNAPPNNAFFCKSQILYQFWNILQHLQNCKSVAYAPSFLEATPEVCQRGTYPIMDTSCFCSCICYTCVHSSHESCNTRSRWNGNQRTSQDFANFILDYGKLPAINLNASLPHCKASLPIRWAACSSDLWSLSSATQHSSNHQY
jgi:hypothetical protein